GWATKSSKSDRYKKHGNPVRSVSMLGNAGGVFTDAGLLIIDPSIDTISHISTIDSDTGRGKKSEAKGKFTIPKKEKKQKLKDLVNGLKMGGYARRIDDCQYVSSHSEILLDITEYHAIYFSKDRNLHNQITLKSPESKHPNSPLLQA